LDIGAEFLKTPAYRTSFTMSSDCRVDI